MFHRNGYCLRLRVALVHKFANVPAHCFPALSFCKGRHISGAKLTINACVFLLPANVPCFGVHDVMEVCRVRFLCSLCGPKPVNCACCHKNVGKELQLSATACRRKLSASSCSIFFPHDRSRDCRRIPHSSPLCHGSFHCPEPSPRAKLRFLTLRNEAPPLARPCPLPRTNLITEMLCHNYLLER